MRRRQHLADIALQARRLAVDLVAEVAKRQQAQDLAFDIQLRGFVADQRVLDAAGAYQTVEQLARGWTGPPDRSRFGHALTLGLQLLDDDTPPRTFRTQPVGHGDAHA